MVQQLHDLHLHIMVSMWSKFASNTSFYQQMANNSFLVGDSEWFDASHPAARALFDSYAQAAFLHIGVDGLWLDATEPEGYPHKDQQLYVGEGNHNWNSYSFYVTGAINHRHMFHSSTDTNAHVYGIRASDESLSLTDTFILTRSAYTGQQRHGAVLWSGDIEGTWFALRR